jgi:RNA polymerase sigma-70 factor, ECF subfamily
VRGTISLLLMGPRPRHTDTTSRRIRHGAQEGDAENDAAMANTQDNSVERRGTTPHQGTTAPAVADDELVEQALRDRAAFAELYRRYLPRVYRYALVQVGGDPQQAQDVTAQTFLVALERLATYWRTGTFIAWLLTLARHKAADLHRARRAKAPLEEAAAVASPEPSPERTVAARLEVAQVVRTLAPERAEALALRLFAELTIGEIASVMGKSEAAVKMLVHRALSDLRERLGSLGDRIEAEP